MSCCIKTSLDCNEIRNVSPSSAHVCTIGQMSEGRRGWKIPAVVATELYTSVFLQRKNIGEVSRSDGGVNLIEEVENTGSEVKSRPPFVYRR